MKLNLIVARARNGVIGRDGDLPWRLPADLAHFKRLTMGHHLIMGRRTFASLPGVLPGRPHVVLSRQQGYAPKGVHVCHGLDEALQFARAAGETHAFVIGGGAVYREALPLADCAYVTEVDAEVDGDVSFEALDPAQWLETDRQPHVRDDRHAYAFALCTYERRR